jgi:hypothetical protein
MNGILPPLSQASRDFSWIHRRRLIAGLQFEAQAREFSFQGVAKIEKL